MKSQIAAALAVSIALSGCATVINGSKQSVSVTTSPAQGAACTLTNSEGTWFLTSPGSVEVQKTKNDMTIECKRDGFQPGRMVATANFGGATVGNVLLGGGVGLIVDAASGANYYYNSPIVVTLGEPIPAASTPASAPTPATVAPPGS